MKITVQIKLIGFLLSLSLLFILSSTIYLIKSAKQDAQVVNIAGRERMLTQLISKELFYALMVKKFDNKALLEAKSEIRKNLDDLIKGNKSRGIYAPPTESIEKQLQHIDSLMVRFEEAIELFNSGFGQSLADYNALNKHNNRLLELSEAVTKSSVEIHAGDTYVDRAGRQRMLTQKMARVVTEFFSLPALKSYEDISGLFVEYDHTLELFKQHDSFKLNRDAKALLEENILFFTEYKELAKRHFRDHMELARQSEFVYDFNLVLLEAIDTVVGSYASNAKAKKEFFEKLQLVAGAFGLIVVLLAFFSIRSIALQFEKFMETTKMLEGGEKRTGRCGGGSELEQASHNIEQFVAKIDRAILHAKAAVAESEQAARDLGTLSEELDNAMCERCADENVRKSISHYLDRSEDIAIQSVEELHSTSELLDKLHENLRTIIKKTTKEE